MKNNGFCDFFIGQYIVEFVHIPTGSGDDVSVGDIIVIAVIFLIKVKICVIYDKSGIVFYEVVFDIGQNTALSGLISESPKNNGRSVLVALNDIRKAIEKRSLPNALVAGYGLLFFTRIRFGFKVYIGNDIKTVFVAKRNKLTAERNAGRSDGVDVEFFHLFDVFNHFIACQGFAVDCAEFVVSNTEKRNSLSVYGKYLLTAVIGCKRGVSYSDAFADCSHRRSVRLFKRIYRSIEVGFLRAPKFNSVHGNASADGCSICAARFILRKRNIRAETVRFNNRGSVLIIKRKLCIPTVLFVYVCRYVCGKIKECAAVKTALFFHIDGRLNGKILYHRLFGHIQIYVSVNSAHFERILRFEPRCVAIFENFNGYRVRFSRFYIRRDSEIFRSIGIFAVAAHFAVDINVACAFHAVKRYKHLLTIPLCGNIYFSGVKTYLVLLGDLGRRQCGRIPGIIVISVIGRRESLRFPVAGHANGIPRTRIKVLVLEPGGNVAFFRNEIEFPLAVQTQITRRSLYIGFQSLVNAVVRNYRRMSEFLVSGNNGSVVLPLTVFVKSRTAFTAREKRRAQTNNNSADSGCL